MKTFKKFAVSTEILANLYQQGLSGTQIAQRVGLEKSAVTRRLKKAGVKLRLSNDYAGEKRYWLWKGENYIDPVTRKRNQRKHRIWSKLVRERDDNSCIHCGNNDSRLHAHHVVAMRDCVNSSLEFDVSNGITLCTKCHGIIHRTINLTKRQQNVYRSISQRKSEPDRT